MFTDVEGRCLGRTSLPIWYMLIEEEEEITSFQPHQAD